MVKWLGLFMCIFLASVLAMAQGGGQFGGATGGTTGGVLLASASNQLLQCTGATNCYTIKQSAGGGQPFSITSASNAVIYTTNIGGTFANIFTGGVAVDFLYNQALNHLIYSSTAPTIAAAGCGTSGASIPNQNGTASFQVNVGTTNSGTCTITMPTANSGWACHADDITTTSTAVFYTKQTGALVTNSITLKNFNDVASNVAWTDSDVLNVSCWAQ